MTDNPRGYARDKVTGRFTRPVQDIDAESRFNTMGDSVEDIDNVSGAPSPSTINRPRYAPAGDELAQGGQPYPIHRRMPVLVPAEEYPETIYAGRYGEVSRAAARRSASPMDPSAWLTGADDGLTPEARAEFLARQQASAQVTRVRDE